MNAIERRSLLARDPNDEPAVEAVTTSGAGRARPDVYDWRSSKTTAHHLQRQAIVYVRQSTPHQMAEHGESLARQYALRDRAAVFGWPASSIVLIDDDLGLSGRGSDDRRGFQRLLADVAQDRVGLVLAIEMSRLARNSREWHDLFELCAIRDTLLADEDGIYDPSDINDRLILGMKGIMSEMELHVMKGRLERGRRNKAERGELFHSVPWGYVLSSDGAVEFDPDEQVRATVRRLFDAFEELGSGYAVVRYLRQHGVKLPKRDRSGQLVWRSATESIVRETLHHPLYAGTYAWGRRQTRARVDATGQISHGRKFRQAADWTVKLHDRVPAYITWEQYQAHQRQLLENLNRPETKGVPREGAALLAGLVFCGRCGRKIYVDYQSVQSGRYNCSRRRIDPTDEVCCGVAVRHVDEHVTRQVLQALSPAALELSLHAAEHSSQQRRKDEQQLRQNLERATHECERAARQYHAVEPENRLVARTLEQRWECTLQQQRAAQDTYERFRCERPVELTAAERRSLEELSHDIPALWAAPETTPQERKEIIRCLIDRIEIVVSASDQQACVVIHWAGGFESRQEFRRPVATYAQLDDFPQLAARVAEMRRAGWRSPRIAAQLNAEGFRTPKQHGKFTRHVVSLLFRQLESRAEEKRRGDTKPPLWRVDALARRLKIPEKKLKDWVRRGWVHAVERPFGGLWILRANDEDLGRLELRAQLCRQGCHYPAELTAPTTNDSQDADKQV